MISGGNIPWITLHNVSCYRTLDNITSMAWHHTEWLAVSVFATLDPRIRTRLLIDGHVSEEWTLMKPKEWRLWLRGSSSKSVSEGKLLREWSQALSVTKQQDKVQQTEIYAQKVLLEYEEELIYCAGVLSTGTNWPEML